MYAPMAQKEFAVLRKLANKAKKHIAEIGKCNEFETHLEALELQQLRETATDLLNLATEIQNKYGN